MRLPFQIVLALFVFALGQSLFCAQLLALRDDSSGECIQTLFPELGAPRIRDR
jgi:hypothetical protein